MIPWSILSSMYRVHGLRPPHGFREHAAKAWNDPDPNTCAVRLAYSLFMSQQAFFKDVEARTRDGRRGAEWYGLPVRANELAFVLTRKLGGSTLVRKREDIRGRTGIIFFDTITGYRGSGHISLWDGTAVVDGGDYFQQSPRVYFWEVK